MYAKHKGTKKKNNNHRTLVYTKFPYYTELYTLDILSL